MLCFQWVLIKQVVDFLLRIFMFYDLVGVNYLSLSLKLGYYMARFGKDARQYTWHLFFLVATEIFVLYPEQA